LKSNSISSLSEIAGAAATTPADQNPKPAMKEVPMTKIITLPAYAATVMNGVPTEQMGRHQFNSYLYDLFECEGKNTVTADEVHEAEDFYVEVFNGTPDGPMIAVHEAPFQLVDIYRFSHSMTGDAA
jgi:hypothetical protein